MNLTTRELEKLLGVSRFQLSRYFVTGRLRKTARGTWDAASVAAVDWKLLKWRLTNRRELLEPELTLQYARRTFRRKLRTIAKARHDSTLTESELREIERAVSAYLRALKKRASEE